MNALANFCFLTKDTNLDDQRHACRRCISRRSRRAHPGALASQWIPNDPELWKIDRFRDFLEARKVLLAAELNRRMEALLHGDSALARRHRNACRPRRPKSCGGINSAEEEAELEALNEWMTSVRAAARRHGL
ncbi:MAG: hypothetical protein MZV65_42495 [Chromatiales bacterium]|nr:hypothetical protein [Chromatiales bacterium]